MKYKKTIFFIGYIVLLIICGLLPFFIPMSIMDDSKENWNGQDLTEEIDENDKYYNKTYRSFTQPTNLSVYDLRDRSYEHQLALTTLQGLVNRDNVSLFLIFRESDEFWMEQLNESQEINCTMVDDLSYWDLFQQYNESYEGLIVYDHHFLETVNVATFLAGVKDCIVVHEDLLENFSLMGITEIEHDFRDKFDSKIELYEWAWDRYSRHATKKMVASYNPAAVFLRDYIVATKMFTFNLSGGPFGRVEEINLFKKILNEYPDNIPVVGWFTDPAGELGELESVKILSKLGKYSLCAAIPDLTVYSSIQNKTLKQKHSSFDASKYKIENKVYITVIVSDGDNVNYCADRLQNLWKNSNRGKVPVGITLEPAMFKIFPNCLDFYYQNATKNEYFLAGPSGAGYCFVDQNPSFPEFLAQSKYAMDQADMDQVWLLNGYEGYQIQYSDEVIDAYTSDECDFTGLYLNYHDFPAELNYVSNDVPVFQSVFVERENELVGKVQALRTANPHEPIFVFVGFWAWDFTFSRLKKADDQLDDNFVFLRPDHFSELFLEYQKSEKDRVFKELIVFLTAGFIPLICTSAGLIYIWYVHKKRKNRMESDLNEEIESNSNEKEDENIEIPQIEENQEKEPVKSPDIRNKILEGLKILSNKAIFFLVNVQLLLIARIFFYSTVLSVVYFVILLVSVYLGLHLKKILDRTIGVKNTLISSLIIFSIGGLLFYFSFAFIVFVGFSTGILLHHQINSSANLFQAKSPSKRSFIYLLILASALILLWLPENYLYLLLITAVCACIFSGLGIYFLIKSETNEFNTTLELKKSKYWYPKAVLFGFLLFLLLVPTFSSENLFFHIFWGQNYFPTRYTIGFNVAATYLGAIILTEFIKMRGILITKKLATILLISALGSYIIIPLFLNGILFFILCNFIFIFGILNFCLYYFDKNLTILTLSLDEFSRYKQKGVSGFIGQAISWLLIGLFLMFIPPPILIADTKEIFVKVEITAINQFEWPTFLYWLLYVPAFRMLLIIPMIILLLLYGALELLYIYFFPPE